MNSYRIFIAINNEPGIKRSELKIRTGFRWKMLNDALNVLKFKGMIVVNGRGNRCSYEPKR